MPEPGLCREVQQKCCHTALSRMQSYEPSMAASLRWYPKFHPQSVNSVMSRTCKVPTGEPPASPTVVKTISSPCLKETGDMATKPLKGSFKHKSTGCLSSCTRVVLITYTPLLGGCVSHRNPCIFISEPVSIEHLPVRVKISPGWGGKQ